MALQTYARILINVGSYLPKDNIFDHVPWTAARKACVCVLTVNARSRIRIILLAAIMAEPPAEQMSCVCAVLDASHPGSAWHEGLRGARAGFGGGSANRLALVYPHPKCQPDTIGHGPHHLECQLRLAHGVGDREVFRWKEMGAITAAVLFVERARLGG
ncbi:hypothetical protein K458DRAFT_398041 [Lentithecium fluviatile CBS 122367]|uniref:Uncharacterized protein n=1 Tax=Lentithecium fluviatile CBS 122367 TaxID=1168545 RepID=A0A6G1JMY6_9PLEO|nr:hypothetical protein K458DRAFT_398041 [Lentithecium fluviatile CBS 122367]